MHNTCAGYRAQVVGGAVLITLAVSAATVDLINNLAYGLSISPTMGAVMSIAAIAVIAVPAAAAIIGKSWHARGYEHRGHRRRPHRVGCL